MTVDFEEWEPVYEAILDDFGFGRAGDERARDRLASMTDPFDESLLDCSGTVAVCGAGPSLADELSLVRRADRVVAASSAADVCRADGVSVDLMVTDLDKNPQTAVQLTHEGVPVAVAAHGDNLPALAEYVPQMRRQYVLPTTQAAPAGPVVNYGGFTDGDRAAFIVDAYSADELVFPGWDLDDPSVDPMKRRKLVWAERLLRWLELRRDERFELLDGRRKRLDMSAFSVSL